MMNINQQFTPKYWVVKGKDEDDVLLHTARKSKQDSIKAYIYDLGKHLPMYSKDKLDALYYENDKLECILIEIRRV